MLRRSFLLFVLALFATAPAWALDNSPRGLIEGMAQQAIAVLGSKDRSDEQIKAKFHELLVSGFDITTIGRFVLGRNWRDATTEQQTEYQSLFESYVVGIYANRFKEYSGETLEVLDVKSDEDGAIVHTRINRPNGAQPVAVDWKVKTDDKAQWRVQDVIIEQVSMSISQRSEFASVIQNGGGKVEALLSQLRSRVGANPATLPIKKAS